MRLRALAVIIVGSVLGAACLFPSLDGLDDRDGGAPDVLAETIDASSEGAPDARTAFCPQDGAFLCSDFDESDAGYLGAWGFAFHPGTTTLQLSTAFAKSPPQSLLIATTSTDLGAGLSKKQISITAGITLSYDVLFAAFGGNTSSSSFSIGSGTLSLQPGAASTTIVEATNLADGGTSYAGSTGGGTATLSTWMHVDFDFDRATTTVSATFDGAPAVTRSLANKAWSTANAVDVNLGIGNSGSETVYYDNVTIRTR